MKHKKHQSNNQSTINQSSIGGGPAAGGEALRYPPRQAFRPAARRMKSPSDTLTRDIRRDPPPFCAPLPPAPSAAPQPRQLRKWTWKSGCKKDAPNVPKSAKNVQKVTPTLTKDLPNGSQNHAKITFSRKHEHLD